MVIFPNIPSFFVPFRIDSPAPPNPVADMDSDRYEAAGFIDVREMVFKVPVSAWARDPHLKELGKMSEENWRKGLGAFSMALFSRKLHWSKTEIEVFLINVRKAMADRNVHAYHRIYVVWGRKPKEGEGEEVGTSAAA